ncbi:leucine-rich repeat domain-containing protein [Fibrella forsythiae]|uniref:Leucine-rich repeat domain-containing protein n=1 Tax=Fibrella forsythiae TaxID=2817061 RepID=A0ABS3JM16_9BACT|nr:leucine-rich repeat domain-containing protein [Fibrella forsythiae]MBO0951054.1 leucine-rich repeat domain-containing protein [Fibrella forsythiae]
MTTDASAGPAAYPALADTPAKRARWWTELEPQWRAAFSQAFFRHAAQPTPEELESLWQTRVLRLVGPRAPYPSLTFELTNCSGLAGMQNLETLVLTHHQLEHLGQLGQLTQLRSLFVNNNAILTLQGIEPLTQLEQLYAQVNRLESIEAVGNLLKLRELYVSLNPIKTLSGLTRQHALAMKQFVCLPSEHLSDRIIMPLERKLGIRFRSL